MVQENKTIQKIDILSQIPPFEKVGHKSVHFFDPTNEPPKEFLPHITSLFSWVLRYSYLLEHPNLNHPYADNLNGISTILYGDDIPFYWYMFYSASTLIEFRKINSLEDIAASLPIIKKVRHETHLDGKGGLLEITQALTAEYHILLNTIEKTVPAISRGEPVQVYTEATAIALWRLENGI